ncbi:flagellar biosynthetic protein FliR [Anoxynatronum buryatiense]|uniref:Flagellar biosynthetic protein FliR n=1 Tax=Anoxynatronum buryatiense TaxID=489973 RepID=A0AA46AI86_9CLOT|nr:flagellar biosynthetic protein FliR [Anoxynatronum buryatiense]SMP47341.1 flagellar biosynthetic protein FliR [Anoxynatronum buryatiense]
MEQNTIDFLLQSVDLFLLVFMRVSGIFVSAPIFSNENTPMVARIGMAGMISFILMPLVEGTAVVHSGNLILFAGQSIQELLVGILIGFVGAVYFSLTSLAGTLLDRQTGFAMVNAIDPLSDTEMPIFGSFYNILFVFIFLSINGHHIFIRALNDSYHQIPIGHVIILSDDLVRGMITFFRDMTVMAFLLSLPVVVTSFLANVVLGIFAKTMPQINVFVVGMPLRIVVGMLTIWVTLQALLPFSESFFDRMFQGIYQMIQLLS